MLTKIVRPRTGSMKYGGINFVKELVDHKGVACLIDTCLGKRVKQAVYSYSDVLLSWALANLCQARRLEDVVNLKSDFEAIPGFKFPSPDRIGDVMKGLALDVNEYETDNATHQLAIHKPINSLALQTAIKLGLLSTSKEYVLDYDNLVIPTEKYDSAYTYKKFNGYQPGVAFLGSIPFYVEGRSGNSNVKFRQFETLQNAFDLAESNGLQFSKFRTDSGSYNVKLMDYLNERGIEFFIKAKRSAMLNHQVLSGVKTWKKMNMGLEVVQVASVWVRPAHRKYPIRYVAIRHDNDQESNMGFIATNNDRWPDERVVRFYNYRGAVERRFDDLLNNFNWKRLPFSFLNQNTVFMVVSLMAWYIYQYAIRKFSLKVKQLEPQFRLKKFYHLFVLSMCEWKGRTLHILEKQDMYEVLLE